jgi:chromosome segregation ATPase
LADLLRRISKELKVEQEDIINAVKKLLNPKEQRQKDKQIENLEKEKTDLQARLSWAEGELAIAKQREKEALQLVKNLSSLLDRPAELIVKASLVQN